MPLGMVVVFVSPPTPMLNPNAQCEVLWLLWHEGGAVMNGISALIKEAPGSSLDSSTYRGPKENLLTRRGPSLDQAGTLISNSQARRL